MAAAMTLSVVDHGLYDGVLGRQWFMHLLPLMAAIIIGHGCNNGLCNFLSIMTAVMAVSMTDHDLTGHD